ncbi:type II toxin-antitoxin system HicB family antitoxin [Candidatus Pacearchaeota archaeon]|nr:type II toxin-antitoxin system HicB family antitoxin [Candidatus Pacearchaeota archaeon]
MEREISFSAVLHEEELDGKTVFVAYCVELGVSDFGDSIDESLSNLKKGISLLLEETPGKETLLRKKEPVLVTRVVL